VKAMNLIIDASTLIAFYSSDELNEPALFHQLANNGCTLLMPQAVYQEIMAGRKPTVNILNEAIQKGIIKLSDEVTNEETIAFRNRHPQLHDGEIQVLLLGMKLKTLGLEYYCVSSDIDAKNVAQKYGLTLKGTRAIISLLNQLKIIDDEKRESLFYRLNHC
jgi:predicted nucleic acid-binding protein